MSDRRVWGGLAAVVLIGVIGLAVFGPSTGDETGTTLVDASLASTTTVFDTSVPKQPTTRASVAADQTSGTESTVAAPPTPATTQANTTTSTTAPVVTDSSAPTSIVSTDGSTP